jgi:hypothetical protein
MMVFLFAIILAAVACVLCTSQALYRWIEGEDMNWVLLSSGIINGILFIIDLYILMTSL